MKDRDLGDYIIGVMQEFHRSLSRQKEPCQHRRVVICQNGWNFLYCYKCGKTWDKEEI
jgi:hypothetical protein